MPRPFLKDLPQIVDFRDVIQAKDVLLAIAPDSPQHPGMLRFSVNDTGIGIAREHHETIFEAFSQADGSTTRKFGGTGLGLAISSQLVSLMHGRIWVDSTPGHGSAFQFSLILQESRKPVAVRVLPGIEELAGLAALVVDDSPTNLRIVSEILFAAAVIYVPPLQNLFGTASLGASELALLATFPMIVWGADELRRWLIRAR